jgi:hypothetical protein
MSKQRALQWISLALFRVVAIRILMDFTIYTAYAHCAGEAGPLDIDQSDQTPPESKDPDQHYILLYSRLAFTPKSQTSQNFDRLITSFRLSKNRRGSPTIPNQTFSYNKYYARP